MGVNFGVWYSIYYLDEELEKWVFIKKFKDFDKAEQFADDYEKEHGVETNII